MPSEEEIVQWNSWREDNSDTPIDLRGADLGGADLRKANLTGGDLRKANLARADLSGARLHGANLIESNLCEANLRGADLSRAKLNRANFWGACLSNANLHFADLNYTDLGSAHLNGTDFTYCDFGSTVFVNVDLGGANGLVYTDHYAASHISTDTLERSEGKVPEEFLQGCGFSPWQILNAKLYDLHLSPFEVAEIQDAMFRERTKGYFLSGIFISYSHEDKGFADKIYKRLKEAGANVWLDHKDLLAGDVTKQVRNAIRLNDVVLPVLSKNSIESDWVDVEINWARNEEKSRGRDVLCPVALDDSWKAKVENSVLWSQLTKKNILDFSKWKTRAFDGQFEKLLKGLQINY